MILCSNSELFSKIHSSLIPVRLYMTDDRFDNFPLMADKIRVRQSAENRRKECHRFWLRLSHSDSIFKRSNISFKENKPDGVDSNSVSTVAFETKTEEFYGFRQTEGVQ